MRKIKENKGITLIALIITIVILLILAVVTIMSATGDGIISKSREAKTKYQDEQAKENTMLENYLSQMEGIVGNNTTSGENIELISKTEPYVGYYADVNADGIVDGVIYADLAIGNTGDGEWGKNR